LQAEKMNKMAGLSVGMAFLAHIPESCILQQYLFRMEHHINTPTKWSELVGIGRNRSTGHFYVDSRGRESALILATFHMAHFSQATHLTD